MKTTMKLLTALFFISTFLISCSKKDDVKPPEKNFFKIDDKEYDLSAGIMESYGQEIWYKGYSIGVTLHSDAISIHKPTYEKWEYTGKGHVVHFELYSTIDKSLDNTDYEYSDAYPNPTGTFFFANYGINVDGKTNTLEGHGELEGGKISVTKKGNDYSITINSTSKAGEKITGFYKGPLRFLDWEGNKSSARKRVK